MDFHWRNTKAELDAIAGLGAGDLGLVFGSTVVFYRYNGSVWVETKAAHSLVWRGEWSGLVGYELNDLVSLNGTTYISLVPHTNHNPSSSPDYWGVFSVGGAGVVLYGTGEPPSASGLLNGTLYIKYLP